MRCISYMSGINNGISISPLNEGYAVSIPGVGHLAFVKQEHVTEMLMRGHAVNDLTLQSEGKNLVWGNKILRCDIEEDQNGLMWLIPEEEENENSAEMLVVTFDHWKRKNARYQCVGGAKVVSSMTHCAAPCTFMLVHLRLGSGIERSVRKYRKVPGTGRTKSHPFRQPAITSEIHTDTAIYLQENGTLKI